MSRPIKSELDEREPELDEASDYDKPLSANKRNWIIMAFTVALIVCMLYVVTMGGF